MKNQVLFLLVVAICLVGFVGLGSAVTYVNSCQTLSISGETYVLTDDIEADQTCFNITASNIVLDGQNHSVQNVGSSGYYGVYIYGFSNITIKNIFLSYNIPFSNNDIYISHSNNNNLLWN